MSYEKRGTNWNREERNKQDRMNKELYDGMKRIDSTIDDLIIHSGGDSNAEVVQARGGKDTLSARLNDIESEKADEHWVLNKLDDKRDKNTKFNKSDYDLSRDSNRWNVNDLDEETREAILNNNNMDINYVLGKESVTNENYVEKSISHNKTDFVKSSYRNLFKGDFRKFYLASKSPYQLIETENYISAVIPIPSNTDLTILIPNDVMDRLAVAQFSTLPDNGSTPLKYIQLSYAGDVNNNRYYIKSENDANYMVITFSTISSSKMVPYLIVTDEKIEIEDVYARGHIIDLDIEDMIKDHTISASKMRFIQKNKANIHDGKYYVGYLGGNAPNNFWLTRDPSNIQSPEVGRCAILKIDPNKTYYIKRSNDTDRLTAGSFSNIPQHSDAPNKYEEFQGNSGVFKTGNDDRYLVVVVTSTTQNKTPERLQVSEIPITDYEAPYKFDLNKVGINSTKEVENTVNFIIEGDLNTDYTPFSFVENTNPKLNDVYSHFDNLVSRYPDYIKKIKLGAENTGLPINVYRFIPPQTRSFTEDIPKILHVCGIHGGEKESIRGTMMFYQDLCEHWSDNELLETLRWNIQFDVIPAFNAWGVENDSRDNSNGVNLNRNFPPFWQHNDEGYDSSGSEPLSEIESQLLDNFISENGDYFFAIDHHRFNTFESDGYVIWTGTRMSENMNKLLSGWSRKMNVKFHKEHSDLVNPNENYVAVHENYVSSAKGWLSSYFFEKGIPGTILEVSRTSNLVEYTTGALGMLFATATKEIINNKSSWLK